MKNVKKFVSLAIGAAMTLGSSMLPARGSVRCLSACPAAISIQR